MVVVEQAGLVELEERAAEGIRSYQGVVWERVQLQEYY